MVFPGIYIISTLTVPRARANLVYHFRCLYIHMPFPCLSALRNDTGSTDVEMDPISFSQTVEWIRSLDLEIVGWYHSHPAFQAEPSVTDIQNQQTHQDVFAKDTETPFLGVIVGVHGLSPTDPRSEFNVFHVEVRKWCHNTLCLLWNNHVPYLPSFFLSSPCYCFAEEFFFQIACSR